MPRRLTFALWVATFCAAAICFTLLRLWLTQSEDSATISFATAEGLQVGKTTVRCRNVEIGKLAAMRLSPDRSRVLADVQFSKPLKRFASCDTRFWIVRPRADTSGVSGLATVISGPYIAVDAGHASAHCNAFVGVEIPPPISSDQNGRRFTLQADSLGSLNAGSPVYFHRMPVGQVLSYAIAPGGGAVNVDVFVNAPYDQSVARNTR